MKIGLLGGTFDPPHFGHLGISCDALDLLSLDQVWWLPTKQNPLKSAKSASFDERLFLCQEIIGENKAIFVKDTERDLQSSYFIDLLQKIIAKNSKDEFFLLIGADNLVNFHLWQEWQKIVDLVTIAVFEREGYDEKAHESEAAKFCQSKQKLIFLKNQKYQISSTDLRKNN